MAGGSSGRHGYVRRQKKSQRDLRNHDMASRAWLDRVDRKKEATRVSTRLYRARLGVEGIESQGNRILGRSVESPDLSR